MKIILFRGRPGAGKTTISRAFSQQRGLVRLSKDDFYDTLFETVSDHQVLNRLSHDVLYRVLDSNRDAELSVVLDYPFQRDEDLALLQAWCAQKLVELVSVLVTCSDPELWAGRLAGRGSDPAPNQRFTDFDALEQMYGSMRIEPEANERVLDSVHPVDVLLSKLEDLPT